MTALSLLRSLLLVVPALVFADTLIAQSPAPTAPTEPAALTAEFERLEREWTDAIVRQDRSTLERFLAPDYALVVSAALDRPVPRSVWLEQAVGPYQVQGYTIEKLQARRVGETVVVSSIMSTQAIMGGVDRSRRFFLTDIWVPTPEGWKVAARYSSMPEETSASSRAVTESKP